MLVTTNKILRLKDTEVYNAYTNRVTVTDRHASIHDVREKEGDG
jgi:hypothetical protein